MDDNRRPTRPLGVAAETLGRVCTVEDLRRVAQWGAQDVGPDASAERVLAWTARVFGGRFVVASSMQDAVLVHLASRARAGVEVLFLDTGYHFAETIATRDAVRAGYPVRVVNARGRASVAEQDVVEGKDLFARDPDRCCRLRKVEPLGAALAGYHAWVTGVRRAEAPSRAHTPLITFDDKHGLVKINPLAAWTDEQLEVYIAEHAVVVNPLLALGYPSIGCAPCTVKPALGADPRSGRWAGRVKTECGLHT